LDNLDNKKKADQKLKRMTKKFDKMIDDIVKAVKETGKDWKDMSQEELEKISKLDRKLMDSLADEICKQQDANKKE